MKIITIPSIHSAVVLLPHSIVSFREVVGPWAIITDLDVNVDRRCHPNFLYRIWSHVNCASAQDFADNWGYSFDHLSII